MSPLGWIQRAKIGRFKFQSRPQWFCSIKATLVCRVVKLTSKAKASCSPTGCWEKTNHQVELHRRQFALREFQWWEIHRQRRFNDSTQVTAHWPPSCSEWFKSPSKVLLHVSYKGNRQASNMDLIDPIKDERKKATSWYLDFRSLSGDVQRRLENCSQIYIIEHIGVCKKRQSNPPSNLLRASPLLIHSPSLPSFRYSFPQTSVLRK